MVTLTGTGRIADDLYLLAHDDVTGKPFLQPRALGAGLAGALLAELIFAKVVRVLGDRIQSKGPPGDDLDALGRDVLHVLLHEPERHPVRDWLLFLGFTAEEDVARRLGRAGYLAAVSSRRPWRKNRWVPANSDCAFAAPLIRVKAVLDHAQYATAGDATLSGLAVACGLGSRVLAYGPLGARGNLDAAIRNLHPGLADDHGIP